MKERKGNTNARVPPAATSNITRALVFAYNTLHIFLGDAESIKMMKKYGHDFTYEKFAPIFTAKLFDPNEWAKLFAKSGAKFVSFRH